MICRHCGHVNYCPACNNWICEFCGEELLTDYNLLSKEEKEKLC